MARRNEKGIREMNDYSPMEDAAPPNPREDILRRFETWLDAALEAEGPLEGIDAELLAEMGEAPAAEASGEADAFALWSAMTGLTQEVKLQSRAFQLLSERLEPLSDAPDRMEAMIAATRTLADSVARLEAEVAQRQLQRERELRQDCERKTARRYLETLVDLHDRILRSAASLQVAVAAPAGWLSRLGGGAIARETLKAHEAGTRLLLERLEASLAEHGVRRVRCFGQPFDPATMVAAAVEEQPGAVDGTVLEELRGGYSWNGEQFRMAEVKVARRPA